MPSTDSAPPRPRSLHLGTLSRFSIVMALLIALAALPQSDLFRVSRINVMGSSMLDPAVVADIADLRVGMRLFAVDAAAVQRRLQADSRIKAANVQIALPGTVHLNIVERPPSVALAVDGRYARLGDDLVAVALAADAGGLPVVIDRLGSVPWVRVGSRVASRGARIVLGALPHIPPALRADLARVTVLPGPDLVLVLDSGLEIRAGGPAGLDERLAQVPRVLVALHAKGVSVAKIDLRYSGSIAVTLATGRRSTVGVE